MKNKETLKFISSNLSGTKGKVIVLSLVQTLLGVLTVGFSFSLRYVINAIENSDRDLLTRYVIVISIIAFLLIAFQIFYRIYFEYSHVEMENKLRSNLYRSILHKDYEYIKKIHDEEWIHRLTSDTSVVASSILSILPSLCRMVVQLVLALVAIIYLYPVFGLSLLPFIVVIILLTYFMRKRLKLWHKRMQEADGKVKVFFFESLQGLSIVHSFVREDIFSKKNDINLEEYKHARIKRNLFGIFCSVGYIIIYYTFYILAIIFCGNAIIDGVMTIGLLTAIVALLTQLTGPLGNLTNIIPRYYALLASGERLRIDNDPQVERLSKVEIEKYYKEEFKSLDIKDISYSYTDKYGNKVEAVKNFSLSIRKGEKILIKGSSGGGKTTLMLITLGLLSPVSGGIYLIDKEEHKFDKKYQRLFSYVPQDNLLMEGTIKEVVTLFEKDVDEDRLSEALRLSESSSFINKLSLKENTYLNEKGSGLSLGEMERIAIARALYMDSPILLLDECSASLDVSTEKKAMDNILSLDKTILLISHHKYDESLFDKVIDLGE